MTSRKSKIVLGCLGLLFLAILIIVVVTFLQDKGFFEEYVEYRAIFKQVKSLKPGFGVTIRGAPIGRVTNITTNNEGNFVVTFKVLKSKSNRITQGSTVTIGRWGGKTLDIDDNPFDETVLPPGSILPVSDYTSVNIDKRSRERIEEDFFDRYLRQRRRR